MTPVRSACALVLFTLAVGCGTAPEDDPAGPTAAAPQTPPNVVLYIVDTLRADGLGSYGNTEVNTAAMDQLAREGTLFERAFAQSSWTRTSIASILTSSYPAAHRTLDRSDVLSSDATLLSELLQEAGYHTGFILTNANVGSFFGFRQGFDTFTELYARRQPGYVRTRENVTKSDELVDRAIEWLREAPEPFFLALLAVDPHSPYTPPKAFDRHGGDYRGPVDGSRKWINRKDLRPADRERIHSLYLAEIDFTDHELARLLDHLRGAGVLDRTITVLTADHGEEFWEHGGRGHGTSLYDEQTRVPPIVRYPPRVDAGARSDRIVQSIDIAPTVLELAGLEVPDTQQGRSLFGPPAADENTFANLQIQRRSLLSVRSRHWKLVWNSQTDRLKLYDMVSDTDERNDISSAHPDVVQRLHAMLKQHIDMLGTSEAAIDPRRVETVDPAELPDEEQRQLRELGYLDDDAP